MKELTNAQLDLLLSEWKNGLMDGEFVTQASIDILRNRLSNFMDRAIHFECDTVKEMVESHDHYTGG